MSVNARLGAAHSSCGSERTRGHHRRVGADVFRLVVISPRRGCATCVLVVHTNTLRPQRWRPFKRAEWDSAKPPRDHSR